MPRVLQMLRRRRRLLLRPLLQTTFLRLNGALANHPNPDLQLPAHRDLPAANETPDETARREAAAATVRSRDLPCAEALFRASVRDAHLDDAVMLAAYLKAGLVDRARRLFDRMSAKGAGAWTTLVSGYCRAGRAVRQDAGPDRGLVDGHGAGVRPCQDADQGEEDVREYVHLDGLQTTFLRLNGYLKAGRVDRARRLFDRMAAKDVVSWTAMVHGYARAGMLREVRTMFDTMPERNVFTWTVMVKAYADRGHITEALWLFDRMPQRNSYSWNVIISGFLRAGIVGEAVHLFERMQPKTLVSWTTMVTGLAQNGRILMAREFFDRMPRDKDITAWNAMITAYANDRQMSEARKLFDSMPTKDQLSWSIVIDGYTKKGCMDQAVGLFLLMLRSAVSPDSTTLIRVLVASRSTVQVGQIHGIATKSGLLSETSLGNALLTRYSRSGDLRSAWQAFEILQEKDAITWTSMMQAFANHGCASCALQAFAQMLRHGHTPSSTTFTAALSACRHAGLVEKGQKIFRSIGPAYRLKTTIEHRDILGSTVRARDAMPSGTRDQEMELKERERKSEDEPAGVEAATESAPTKAATISVGTLQASYRWLSKKLQVFLRTPSASKEDAASRPAISPPRNDK